MENKTINPQQAQTTLTIIWFALLFSQFLFVGLVYVVRPELMAIDTNKPLLGDNALILGIISLTAVSNLVFGFAQRRKFLAQSVAEQKVELVQTGMIIGIALCESVSLFGVLLALAFNYQYFFIFSAIGIIGTILYFPKPGDIRAASYKI